MNEVIKVMSAANKEVILDSLITHYLDYREQIEEGTSTHERDQGYYWLGKAVKQELDDIFNVN